MFKKIDFLNNNHFIFLSWIKSMLKLCYNNSDNHIGPHVHCEVPQRINKCITNLHKIFDDKIFIQNEISSEVALENILIVHDEKYILSLKNMIPKKYICRKCKQIKPSNNLNFKDFVEEHKKNCKENLTTNDIYCQLDSDTYFTDFTFNIILEGVGCMITLLNELKQNTISYGFALIRPPGHHCNNDASGFCIVNNAIVACKYAQKIGYQKIFILDIDFHHGNGTQELIENNDNNNIYFCSIHGYGESVYPYTGDVDENNEKILNIPLVINFGDKKSREYITDDYYLNLIETDVTQFINKVIPDMIIISCGFDGHKDDPLEGFNLTDNAYVRIFEKLKQYNVPLLFITEGGYSVGAIYRTVQKMVECCHNL